MFCSRSIGVHLLKGLGAFVLIGLTLYISAYQQAWILATPVLLLGAVLLFRGCPMCWLVGLFETVANGKEPRPGPSDPGAAGSR